MMSKDMHASEECASHHPHLAVKVCTLFVGAASRNPRSRLAFWLASVNHALAEPSKKNAHYCTLDTYLARTVPFCSTTRRPHRRRLSVL